MSRIWLSRICICWVLGFALFGCILAEENSQGTPSGPPDPAPEASFLKLAGWNIRIFSNSRTDEQLRSICKVAKQFDFIAITELRDEAVLKRFVNMLRSEFGRDFAYNISPSVGREVLAASSEAPDSTETLANTPKRETRSELYAFVYDRSRVSLVKSGVLFEDNVFFRYPYYATFRAGNFDFTTIVIHVIWGDTVAARRREINRLAHVYREIQDADPNEQDIVLLGDFNRNPDDDLAWGPLFAISSMYHAFNLPEKSMIWDTNLYDNILFQSCYLSEFTLDSGIVRFDETDFGNDDDEASRDVSDHRPVWTLFRTDSGDDD